uniref:Uncharacterized protein n=1 Tax=Anopheles epiroticus TaxID=199890 RepID=A0A182PY13_9DIPT
MCTTCIWCGLGGTIVGAPFGGYAPFGHPPSAVLPPPRHAAFYPQPILYWGYPSPPVSPTTYYSTAPPGTPHHLGPPGHQAAGIPAHSHTQPTMLALSPDQRSPQRSNPSVSLVTLPPRAAGTGGSPSSGESSTSQSSSPPLLSPTGSTIATSSSGSVTSGSSGTAQRHGTGTTIRTSPPPTSLLTLPLAAPTSQPLAIPAVTTPTGGLAGPYPGSQLSPIQAMPPPPPIHFPHASLMGTASPPGAAGAAGATFYDPHLSHHHSHLNLNHHHHHHHHPHHAPHLTHHHHDKLVTTAPSILTPSLIPNQYVELFIV